MNTLTSRGASRPAADRLPTLLLLTAMLSGCAASFTPAAEPARRPTETSNGDVTVRVTPHPMDQYGRYSENSQKRGYTAVLVEVESSGNEVVEVDYSDVRAILGNESIVPVSPFETSSQVKQRRIGLHWLWALLNLRIERCENFDCRAYWIPIGIVPAIYSYSRAARANKQFREYLESNAMRSGSVSPGEVRSGLVYYPLYPTNYFEIELRYRVGSDFRRISVPYANLGQPDR